MDKKVLFKTNFYFNFYERKLLPGIYTSIQHLGNTIPIQTKSSETIKLEDIGTLVVELFPSYFNFELNEQNAFDLKRIFRVKGYCISIEKSANTSSYLQKHFKPNFRTSMRRRLKGLEICFNISYKMFYGNIDRDDYHFLMTELRAMLIRRFTQRQDKNMALNRWDDYYSSTYELINEKKASLYVIYDDNTPIQISLSYHCEKILFLSIPSYNIDYSKFGLGNIAVYKILEWCMANNYRTLDMGYGAFDYKVKWCNESYNFEQHVFYRKSSILSRILLIAYTLKTKLINYLISKNANVHFHNFKNILMGTKMSNPVKIEVEKVANNSEEFRKSKQIYPSNDLSYLFLRKAMNDFAYTQLANISEIMVYESERNKTYYFKSNNKTLKISYNS